jgi:hypothetical protein
MHWSPVHAGVANGLRKPDCRDGATAGVVIDRSVLSTSRKLELSAETVPCRQATP